MVKIIMAVVLAAAGTATAAGPTETVKAAVQQVFAQPGSPAAKAPSIAERRAQIRKVTETLFDFDEMARRTLTRHWASRSPEEQAEFVRLFTDLLERSYMGRIESWSDEKIVYTWLGTDTGHLTNSPCPPPAHGSYVRLNRTLSEMGG